MVLVLLLGSASVFAQATGGLHLTSSAMVGESRIHTSSSSVGYPIHSFASTSYFSRNACTASARMREFSSGSKYASHVSEVGASLSSNPYSNTLRHRRDFPINPGDPIPDPVGEVPFVLMAILLAAYIAFRFRKQLRMKNQ